MSRRKFIAITVCIIIFFVIVVPIGINECYKIGPGYITKWDAADVLSYYGTVLGATATATAMVATITFTRKQIDRDNYLKREDEKWAKIDAVFADALNSINPMISLIEIMDTGFNDPSATITIIQKYRISCKVATDQLNGCLSTLDYPKVKKLIDEINDFSVQISEICTEKINLYSKLRDLLNRDTAKRAMAMETQNPGSFPSETITSYSRIIRDTDGLISKDIEENIGQVDIRIAEIYQSIYRNLLQLKGSTFETINTEIQKEADNILRLWGRK